MQNTRMQPIVALKALGRLLKDPQKTEEVFTVIRALSGPSLRNGYLRFSQTEVGRRVFRESSDLVDTLMDREALAALPAGTLGRIYLDFVIRENITADGLVEASMEDGELNYLEGDLKRFGMRQRDMHDLWHTVTQYGTDELGELCLLAFTYAQTRNRGIGLICLAGAHKMSKVYGRGVWGAIWRGYQDGKRAAWLPAQDWEALLSKPIEEVRQQLGIKDPDVYYELSALPA